MPEDLLLHQIKPLNLPKLTKQQLKAESIVQEQSLEPQEDNADNKGG